MAKRSQERGRYGESENKIAKCIEAHTDPLLGYCTIPVPQMAKETGYQLTSTYAALTRLIAKGRVVIVEPSSGRRGAKYQAVRRTVRIKKIR